jgi:hypothetical protein
MNTSKEKPGTVSEILWHFTGGPIWDEQHQKQSNICKSARVAFKNIVNILRTMELRLGNYREIARNIIEEQKIFDLDIMQEKIEKNVPIIFESLPISCVAEIPIQHLSYHSKRYGKYAIGFRRNSLLKQFRPVTYIFENDKVLFHLINACKEAILIKNDINDMPDQIMQNIDFVKSEKNNKKVKLLCGLLSDRGKRIEYVEQVVKRYISYIKTMSYEELDTIYCEREWRSIETYKFKYSDIAFIVLPRSYFLKCNSEYINYFTRILNIPRSIPIIPWEDFIE